MENTEIIIRTIKDANKPLKGGEIAELSGLDKKIVDKLIKQLKTEELIYSPKRCFYDVKK
ncbi:MAG: MarR family transcriptional regulator [Chlorobi bacterium]|nr:MarR family transcriptional regulator [Chlorobiota bacterium]